LGTNKIVMQNFDLIDYYRKGKILSPDIFDNLKYELDQHIYYYGNHFKYPKEKARPLITKKRSSLLKFLFMAFQIIKNRKIDHSKKTILSNSYFNLNNELRKLGYNVFSPSWMTSSDRRVLTNFKLYMLSQRILKKFDSGSFSDLISQSSLELINDFSIELDSFVRKKDISALIVPNDVTFFENLSIQVCQRNKIPSFVFLHGLPGRYNLLDENRADYLIVWGDKIKENYIRTGFNPSKILISGHPLYATIPVHKLRFGLDNVLVLTKSLNGSQHGNEVILGDRGNLILYLLKIEKVLKSLGVKMVRYRPHPSENHLWYNKFIDTDFFHIDTDPLNKSLLQSTLVIGPTSTVMVESIFYGVNYLVFEPNVNKIDLFNYPLVPPFDGSDNKVPVAMDEADLMFMLRNRTQIDISFLKDYIKTPFSIEFIRKLF
jgi:hypothetical protein